MTNYQAREADEQKLTTLYQATAAVVSDLLANHTEAGQHAIWDALQSGARMTVTTTLGDPATTTVALVSPDGGSVVLGILQREASGPADPPEKETRH